MARDAVGSSGQGVKALVLSGGMSGGHRMVAEALREELEHREIPCAHLNALDLTWRPVTSAYQVTYRSVLSHAPWLWGWLYKRTRDRHRRAPPWKEHLHAVYNRLQGRRLERFLEDADPALLVCTHYYPAEVVSRMRRQGRLHGRIVFVLTDHEPHPFHVFDEVDLFTVASDAAAQALLDRGVPRARVGITGIPVRASFRRLPGRAEACRALGLDPGQPVVLVLGGMLGLGKVSGAVRDLCKNVPEAQVVVVCGRNIRLREGLSRRWRRNPRVRPLGYVREMARLMAATDLAVGKPGGATTSELLACGVPFLAYDPIPGQEEANARYLQKTGAGAVAGSRRLLGPWARRIVREPAYQAALREAALAVSRAGAAGEICDAALALLAAHPASRSRAAARA